MKEFKFIYIVSILEHRGEWRRSCRGRAKILKIKVERIVLLLFLFLRIR